jgi:hypothetical protein
MHTSVRSTILSSRVCLSNPKTLFCSLFLVRRDRLLKTVVLANRAWGSASAADAILARRQEDFMSQEIHIFINSLEAGKLKPARAR